MPGPNKVGKKTGRKTQYGRDEYITIKGEKVSEKSRTLKSRKKSMLPKQDYVNVPSIHDGYQYTEEQLSRMLKEGRVKPTSKHRNIPEAVKQAKKRSKNMKFKYKGGLTNTVPPKRGPKPQGYRKGADVDFFAAGNEDFQYGEGKASYTFEGKKSSITPSLSASAYKVKDKSIKGKLDRVSVKGEYKPNKKVNLKGEVSRNVHGKKDYRAMLGAEYKNKNKKFKGSIDETGRANLSFSMGFKHGGCPHREIGVKSNIKGISGIQLKGQKFTGTK